MKYTQPLFKSGRYSTFPNKAFYLHKELGLNPMDLLTAIKINRHNPNRSIPLITLGTDDRRKEYSEKEYDLYRDRAKKSLNRLIEKGYAEKIREKKLDAPVVDLSLIDKELNDYECSTNYNPEPTKSMKRSRWNVYNMCNGFIQIPHVLIDHYGKLGLNNNQLLFLICLFSRKEGNPVRDSDPIFPFGPQTVKERRDELVKMDLLQALQDGNDWRYDFFNIHNLMLEKETGHSIEKEKEKFIFYDDSETPNEIIDGIVEGFYDQIGAFQEEILTLRTEMTEMRKGYKSMKRKLSKLETTPGKIISFEVQKVTYGMIQNKHMRSIVKRYNKAVGRSLHIKDVLLANGSEVFVDTIADIDERLLIQPVLRNAWEVVHGQEYPGSYSLSSMYNKGILHFIGTRKGWEKTFEYVTGFSFVDDLKHIQKKNGMPEENCGTGFNRRLNIYAEIKGLDKLDLQKSPKAV